MHKCTIAAQIVHAIVMYYVGQHSYTDPPFHLRPRKRGKRAGALVRLKRRRHRSPLESILLSNVRSLVNKQDELSNLIESRQLLADCSVLCFTESCRRLRSTTRRIYPPSRRPKRGFTKDQKRRCMLLREPEMVHRHKSSHGPVLRFWRRSP